MTVAALEGRRAGTKSKVMWGLWTMEAAEGGHVFMALMLLALAKVLFLGPKSLPQFSGEDLEMKNRLGSVSLILQFLSGQGGF